MVEKFPVYHHFLTIINLSLSSKKRAKSLKTSEQCSLIDNGSTLTLIFLLITGKSLSDVDFSIPDIKSIISKVNSNKAHGDDMISIRMLKLCDESICKPLNIILIYQIVYQILADASLVIPVSTNYWSLLMKNFQALRGVL